eukprot:scaffold35300_cov63-Phaeocystis_antarctica.AAC.1
MFRSVRAKQHGIKTACHWPRLRHLSASPEDLAFHAGALHIAADRSKCAAASLSSAAERGPTSQARYAPLSTIARMSSADSSFGAARKTFADSALSPSSFHHSGLATSVHSSVRSVSKASAVACAQYSEPTGWRSLASRNRCAASTLCPELESAAPRAVPQAFGHTGGHQLVVLIARLRGGAGLLLRGLANPMLQGPTILICLPLLPHPLVERPVQLPSARVRRTVHAAE